MRMDAGRPHDLDGVKEAAPGHRGSDAQCKIEVLGGAAPRSGNAEEVMDQQHDAEEVVEDKDESSHSNGEAAAQELLEVHHDILKLECHYRSPGTIQGRHE